MQVGQRYFVSFEISAGFTAGIPCFCDKVGVKFTTEFPIGTNNSQLINNSSHFKVDTIISDTTNWNLVSGNFIADSTYNTILIGNFYTTSAINYYCIPHPFIRAYYYIDRVCVSLDSVHCTRRYTYTLPISEQEVINVWVSNQILFVNVRQEKFSNKFLLFDVAGRLILSIPIIEGINEINISEISFGLYVYRIQNHTSKLIISQEY
jgi:hypothetical protein